ncbi:hypothetical protein F4X10_11015 [Candidatus Poribacteria bacterium]|nr:hypothetical protein [Candidatus Poribacteria bacterium]
MEEKHEDYLQILPIADTISGSAARENPKQTLEHYNSLANQFWLSSKVSDVADNVFSGVQRGYTTWGSLSGPYGFGKTASAIALWAHARNSEFLAIPPLSCTNFNELAAGIASLAGAQNPQIKKQVDKLFQDVFTDGLKPMVQADAKRYAVPPQTVRKIYNDKFSAGQFTVDSHPHRTVEFLSKLGELATENTKGLVIILDELQQLLGPLDARAIIQFREFVWGLRTERSPCGIILALDSLLEARLARWASDILHRIRENGPALQLTDIYTKEFPEWLWDKFSSDNRKRTSTLPSVALSENVLTSLGQFVERPDLANGPRTVVDIFARAAIHYQDTRSSYDIPDLVDDIHQGRFRYFGEGATVQSILTQILSDEWILEDEGRKKLVTTLVAFPQGCPKEILHDQISDKEQIKKARSELFAPLLVELSDGLALELLQQVRRTHTNWEQILSRCWERLPSFDALAAQTPNMILRVLIPKLFPKGTPTKPIWERISDESNAMLTGWYIFRGTFDDAYPQREVALCVTDKEPESWPGDVDVSIALVCDTSTDPDTVPRSELLDKNEGSCILMRLPILKPLVDRIPADLQRYEKYIQPEPFRPVMILAALHDLEAFLGNLIDNSDNSDKLLSPEEQIEMDKGKAFTEIVIDFVLRELMNGTVDVGTTPPISLRGPELLRALFAQACRRHFPQYQTLATTAKWEDVLSDYREGLKSGLSPAECQGRKEIVMPKAEIYETLFGQMSTAAGDSFIKKLGPFVQTKNNSKSFSLRLAMHPAEHALISYLKRLPSQQFLPFDAAVEFLRHLGYTKTETEEIVKILVARECLTRDSSGNIRFILNADIERDRLLERINEANRELCFLEVTDAAASISQSTAITDLQKHLNQQQVRLQTLIDKQIKELENSINSLQVLIGTVDAAAIPMEWLDSNLSTHLTGIAAKLKDSRENLLEALRKESKKLTKELDFSSDSADVKWAIAQKDKKETFSNSLQKLQKRVKEFEERVKALISWKALNSQLRSTDMLCAKVSKTEPALKQTLNQLVTEFKEWFATDLWDPLLAASKFSKKIRKVQSDVQGHLYSHVQTFNKELAEIRDQFNFLLPSTAPPVFDVSKEKSQQIDSIHESFQKLYQWAFEGFRTAVAECQELKRSGAQWRDPDNKRRSWKELKREVETALRKSRDTLSFEVVQRIGSKVLLMQRGLTEATFGLFDNSDKPPDFEKLKRLFKEGKIHIQVSRKT